MLVKVLFFCLETKEKIPKEKLQKALTFGILKQACSCSHQNRLFKAALPVLPAADGTQTRYTQTDRPLPTSDSTYAYAPTVRPGDHAA